MSKSASRPAELFEDSPESRASWKQEVNERLAAHRNRRGGQDAASEQSDRDARPASGRAAEAAARVAARYAKAPSYSQVLAGEARAAVRAAEAAAEAALTAHAAAQAVLDGLESRPLPPHLWQQPPAAAEPQWEETTWQPKPAAETQQQEAYLPPASSRWQDEPPAAATVAAPAPAPEPARPWPGAQPRWEAGLTPPVPQDVWSEMRVHPAPQPRSYAAEPNRDQRATSRPGSRLESRTDARPDTRHDARLDARLDPRIYRHSRSSETVAEEHHAEEAELFENETHIVEPVELSHANLIEFPRELVAARKARPRLAEGPLYNHEEHQQLNIFETVPEPAEAAEEGIAIEPARWASIELDHPTLPDWRHDHEPVEAYARHPEMLGTAFAAAVLPVAEPARPAVRETATPEPVRQQAASLAPPEMLVASFSDRMLAGLVDGALVTLAFVAASVVVIASTNHPPAGKLALLATACGFALFAVIYQFLFLSFTEEGTPGMRYARIALCTFADENPTLSQMQMRVPAMVLAALPAGLGLLWSLWDKDHIGWHDRWTQTYQRKY